MKYGQGGKMILPAYGFVESPCRVREVLWQLAFGNKDYLTGKRLGKVATEYAIRSERTECAKVDFLTERLSGIVWARENTCREVLHPDNLVFRRTNLPRHCEDVQPSVRCSLQCAVVEVESVNMHNRSHLFLSKSESRPVRGGPAPVRRSYSGVR